MYYEGNNINVILLNESYGVPGSVWCNADDSYTIFIDSHLSAEQQKEVFQHEISHIMNGDFEKTDVQQIEAEAHGLIIPKKAERIPADKFKKRLEKLQKEKARIQKKLQEREREIEVLVRLHGNDDFLFDAAEYRKFYGGCDNIG